MEDMLFETVELETPIDTDTSVKDVISTDENAPSITDPEWNEYVMSMFTSKELYDGNPLVNGLRRVAELVIGPIVYSGPTQVFPPQRDDHHGRATVVFTVEFEKIKNLILVGWVIYPLGYLAPVVGDFDAIREVLYTIADIINKVGLGVLVLGMAKIKSGEKV